MEKQTRFLATYPLTAS